MKKLLIVLLALASGGAAADTIEMKVYGMVCALCEQNIDRTMRQNPATADVVVSLEDKLVAVATRPGRDISDAELTKTLADAGFEVKGITRTGRSLSAIRAGLKKAT